MGVRFGDYWFDRDRRQIERLGKPIHVSPKAFELLTVLIEASPRALSKEELSQSLWPDVVVVEANLPNLIAELRRALGEPAREAGFIRTVHRYGYAFSHDDRKATYAGASFELRLGKREFPLRRGVNVLGRSNESVVPLRSARISRHHAQITVTDQTAVIEDLQSRHGTFIGSNRVSGIVELRDGDEVILAGELAGRFRIVPAPAETA